MKKLVLVSLFVFWAVVTAVLAAGLILRNNNAVQPTIQDQDQSQNPDQVSGVSLTIQEIAKHNLVSDCWIVISNKVYDLTGFLKSHPGGSNVIIPYCGKDGTTAFNTKDLIPAKSHSAIAANLLAGYFLGNLGANINSPTNNQPAGLDVQNNQSSPQIINQNTNQDSKPTSNLTLTLGEIATHNSQADCWMIISNKVYNVTNYLRSHPGGLAALTAYCGKDATNAFASVSHSQTADNIHLSYYIGDVGQGVSEQTIQNSASVQPSSGAPGEGEDQYEDEYESEAEDD